MQDLILNILFCCLTIILGVLIIIIKVKSKSQGFDNRILFSITFFLQGLYFLLSSFEFEFLQQKLRYIFTLGVINALFLTIALHILLDKKHLTIIFISGIFYLVQSAFAMITVNSMELSIVTLISLLIPVITLMVATFTTIKRKESSKLTYQSVLCVIGLLVLILAYSAINFGLFDLIEDETIKAQAYFGEILLVFIGYLIIFLSISYAQIKKTEGFNLSLKISLTAILTALCVVLSFLNPFAYFNLGDFKPNPFVHMINAIAGVFLGPFWGVLIASLVAVIRFTVGIGTIHAFSGGIPGALVVGVAAIMISLLLKEKYRIYAAFFEPVGTFGIGAIISSLIIGTFSSISLWLIFLVSSLVGCSLGFWVLWTLQKRNININYLSRGDTVIPRREII